MTAGLDGVKAVEGRLEVMAGDGVFVDVDRVEDGLVEQASLILVTPSVELLGILK